MNLRTFVPSLVVALCLTARTPAFAEEAPAPVADDGAFVQGEKSVETRLLAPCCWNGTLDVHESDLARDLRREIRARLRGGETVDAVEESLVARYGERVRATPKSERVGLLLGGGVLAVAMMALLLLRKSVRSVRPAAASASVVDAPRDLWDERLDEELERRRSLIS